ncbi:MAG: ABC transporter permease [Flavobacteriales bacterium]|nr:MAG: ABC transporter permease [Bacteroidota bacterium]KXK33855.1 MAG: peptide/nickel transport system permease protein [Chlorobi bacterium OLB6]MBE2266019.1 ABC transporter permease [Flavobacteriales bacterium]MBV6464579.1 Inner membrane ABC transporter permease protein YejE [Chlorobiota bacterium]MBW7854331.1 ABC transporter permease [Candidatus Kapabacteria bacterium]MCC6330662.1 ABC transporter permease [Ignavibacteria bacterium]
MTDSITAPKDAHAGESYSRFVRRQFKKSTFGMASIWLVIVLVCVAMFADFLANNKPIACSYKGSIQLPIFKEYLVGLGLSKWTAEEATREWSDVTYDWSIFPPVPYGPSTTDKTLIALKDRAPSSRHWLGTDDVGRDVFAGIIHGSRYALSIGLVAMSIALALGIVLGTLAGYYGGTVDLLISRLIEIVITMPSLFLILTISAMVEESSIWLIMLLIGLTGWTSIARFMRGEVLRVRNLDYVSAATSLGYSTRRIMFKHVLPNAIAPVLVYAAFGIVGAILLESALSFLGFGVPPTVVTWGSVLYKARSSTYAWWLAVFPGLTIFITVVAFNFIGDALRDATDPRLRG